MKKLIRSSTASNGEGEYFTYQRGRQQFGVHVFNDNPIHLKFQVKEIHPYDLEEYTWARCGYKGALYVEFIRNGKVLDGMQMHYYDEEDYEDENEYVNDIIDQVCVELRYYNKNIEPRIDHT